MANRSFTVDQLFRGSASTAPWQRRAGQIESSTNVRFDVRIGGASKRNATRITAGKLYSFEGVPVDPSKHFLWIGLRNTIIAVGGTSGVGGDVYAWNLDTGAPLEIVDRTLGTEYVSGSGFRDYISSVNFNARRDLRYTTQFDTAIIAFDDTGVSMLPTWSWQQSLNYLVNGDPDAAAGISAVESSASPLNVFSDFYGLPEAEGDVFRVSLSEEDNPAGIYIRYNGDLHADYVDGFFPDHDNRYRIPETERSRGRFDNHTMPHRIIYDEVNQQIILDECPWQQRLSGTNATNSPVLRGKSIRGVEFHDGRLFLITSDGLVVGSRRNDYFNLWHNNVAAIADDDRIAHNTPVSGTGQTLYSVICGPTILLLTQTKVIAFGAPKDEHLTSINGDTSVVVDMQLREPFYPGWAAGIVTVVDSFLDVQQFQYTDSGVAYTGLLTAHHRNAINGMNTSNLRVHQIETTTFVTDNDGPAALHDSFFLGGEMIQSAWGVLDCGDAPVFIHPWNGTFNIVTRDAVEGFSLVTMLHKQEITSAIPYLPRLDRLQLIQPTEMDYDIGTDTTTVFHSERDGDISLSRAVLLDTSRFMEKLVPVLIETDGGVVFEGDLTGEEIYLGFLFETELTLSRIYPETSPLGYTIQRMSVFHYDTEDYVLTFYTDPNYPNAENRVQLEDGVLETMWKEFMVKGDPRFMTIKLSSMSAAPATWMAIEYEYIITDKGR